MIVMTALLVLLAFAAIAALQWSKSRLSQRADAARAELIERLAERFGDSDDFKAFAMSPEGRIALGARDPAVEIGRTLLMLAQAAILLAALGVGFMITVVTTPANADINLIREAEEAKYWGTFALLFATGLSVSFWIGQNRARAWGLLPR